MELDFTSRCPEICPHLAPFLRPDSLRIWLSPLLFSQIDYQYPDMQDTISFSGWKKKATEDTDNFLPFRKRDLALHSDTVSASGPGWHKEMKES